MLIVTSSVTMLSVIAMIFLRRDIAAPFAVFATIGTFIFTILVVIWVMTVLLFSYNCKYGFEKEYRVIQHQSNLLQAKKEAVLKQSSELKQADSKSSDIVGLVDKVYLEKMIEGIQKIESSIVYRKSNLLRGIEDHNAASAFWLYGRYSIPNANEKFKLLYTF